MTTNIENLQRQIDAKGVLCYVSGNQAWFTTQPLEKQWGEYWDDASHEHNAEDPYGPCWHNLPILRNDPEIKRGWKPGTKEPYAAGEMCQCETCLQDWNADGTPKWHVFYVFFEGAYDVPCENCCNSPYSVEAINRGDIAWLRPNPWGVLKGALPIHAGTTCQKFVELIEQSGGCIYEPRKD